MKKFLRTLMACIVLVPCMFMLFACNDPETPPPPTLTNAQYSKALEAVSNSLSSSSSQGGENQGEDVQPTSLMLNKNLMLETSSAYVDATPEDVAMASMMSGNMIKFISAVVKNPTYVHTNDIIRYVLNDPTGSSSTLQAVVRQRLQFDGTYITGLFICNIDYEAPAEEQNPEAPSTMHSCETILFKINYDFATDTLKSYEVKEEYSTSPSETIYVGVIYNGEKITMLSRDPANEAMLAEQTAIHNACAVELAKTYVETNYDFNAEYAQAVIG